MTDIPPNLPESQENQPRWQPLSSIDRRVFGVLIEKAKTTTDAYPLSLNAVRTGCNQKSNRDPVMSLEPEDIEESLDRLREWGAVSIIQGIGRVSKYRHFAYEWLGVDKVEMAVMGELLLRGVQTVGELRSRASRMEPIGSLSELRPILESLKSKGLVVSLTPEGRGHIVTHAIYQPRKLESLRAKYHGHQSPASVESPAAHSASADEAPSRPSSPPQVQAPIAAPATSAVVDSSAELSELRAQLAEMREQIDRLTETQERTENDLRELKDALGA